MKNVHGLGCRLRHWLSAWGLVADGASVETPRGLLLPVIVEAEQRCAMLKVSADASERAGMRLLRAWAGRGAVRVFRQEDDALLMARGSASLLDEPCDDRACAVLCDVIGRLHDHSVDPRGYVPLAVWFQALLEAPETSGAVIMAGRHVAFELLAASSPSGVLHGDLHHGNVLWFGPTSGWSAIDPKGLVGPLAFDYVPMFLNPDLADPGRSTARDAASLDRRLALVEARAGRSRDELLRWVLAYACLSALWSRADGQGDGVALSVADLAARRLGLVRTR
ncbi:streptomycin 6-kinase [Ameyamaea chiangmaiensis NBRC 103196]|uniref:APH(6) family putative aminoglycoside O-phosphotransferase n=1 Tax=Ameyamaea chiangmaiensis TaxID=442969 RepID=A0A850PIY2_9PROT|nr:aminoglycoside phosphotransferase family protein [Ameyamaea chiangmaiensis]MBS4074449.1 APH(6) family putative aminoglycoside O-phosphotransferase [Ameyamaea chiangmaiensis]NVN41762.1 APH(6) family putative aminoglycoside O-phosphotransferase [Ameyamaea chiangmaiensis]GBQ72080.1 streptomycin 6-kinase [Ameyamaea chiangmaiensis NBRC 103196]